jgi:hypothetical protein
MNLTWRIGLLLAALTGCDVGGDGLSQRTVTVKLPAARSAEPAPGFTFEGSKTGTKAKTESQ